MDAPSSRKQKWTLTIEAFDGLLSWLAPDREQAGVKYEEIRLLLVKGFRKHGCTVPEELADETINRVARKLPEIASTYVGDPVRYFYGVAHLVHMEYLRKPKVGPLPPADLPSIETQSPLEILEDTEHEYTCLRLCMERLSARDRELIMQYYRGERQIKISLRKELAERLGIKLENLRLRAQRIRATLKECVINCMGRKALA
ncbi:MAG: sigma-70 family RNA polymerase sigma factor [Pyrinomonadaceae bacterium]